MASILWTILLHSVVCQVNEVIVEVLSVHGVGLAGGAQVALSEEVDVHVLGESDPDPDVKLSFVDQQGPLDILLYDEGLRADYRFVVGKMARTTLCLRSLSLIFHWHDHCCRL